MQVMEWVQVQEVTIWGFFHYFAYTFAKYVAKCIINMATHFRWFMLFIHVVWGGVTFVIYLYNIILSL